jgi:hypothetical protein
MQSGRNGLAAWLSVCGIAASGVAGEMPARLSLPMDPVAATNQWVVTEATNAFTLGLVSDEILGSEVLEIRKVVSKAKKAVTTFTFTSKTPLSGAFTVEAWVRFPWVPEDPKVARQLKSPPRVTISCGTLSGLSNAAPAYSLSAGAGGGQFSWSGRWGTNATGTVSLSPLLKAESISPFSREAFRLEMEAGVAATPVPSRTWIPLRIEVGPDRVRMYGKGVLVLEGQAPAGLGGGPVELAVNGDVRVARLRVQEATPAAGPYVRVPLDSRVNASGPVDLTALGQPRDAFLIEGIPFQLASGVSSNDHVDVGASVFRDRMGTSYYSEMNPTVHTQPAGAFDPGRIRLAIPMRSYARAWILAGANDLPNRTPVMTLRFYKPMTDWSTDASITVPSMTAKSGGPQARPVPAKARDGKAVMLWLVPIELDTAELSANYPGPLVNIELTKEIKPCVAYPDPFVYSYQPGGLPSGVQVYGLTFEEAPVRSVAAADMKGAVYVFPEMPTWRVALSNQAVRDTQVVVKLEVTDPYGKTSSMEQKLAMRPGEERTASFALKPAVNGLHTVRTIVTAGDWRQSRDGTFLALPAIDRKATGLNSPWGVWTWNGGHGTLQGLENNARLLRALGAINHFPLSSRPEPGLMGDAEPADETPPPEGGRTPPMSLNAFRAKWGLGPTHYRLVGKGYPPWSAKDPVNSADYEAYKEDRGKALKSQVDAYPDLQYANCFAENYVSLRLSHGVTPDAVGQPWFVYDAMEKTRLHALLTTANAAAEGVRKYAPGVKFLFGHSAPGFPIPFFREQDWNSALYDGFGLDMPQFERMPERQPRATEPCMLYFLRREMKARGMDGKELVHLESYFPSSHELALGWRGQADSVVRTAVLSLALGTTKFMHTWSLQDCSDDWGSQHYGCVGFLSREPERHPKPAAAAFATMTRVLDLARYDGWLETGSRSAFCVRFRDTDRLVYACWTIRGSRPLEITADQTGAQLVRIDESGNESPVQLAGGRGSVDLSPTPCWIVAKGGAIRAAQVGAPVYTEAPGPIKVVLDDFESQPWTWEAKTYNRYASNHWDVVREPARMRQELVREPDRGSTVWRVTMDERPAGQSCVGFYGVFTPAKPIPIPGSARALGFHGKGSSQWFRVVYEVTDAQGEVWLSCGKKDRFNADDIHSRSYFNHDGWRYMEFPLPSSSPGDNFRERGCYSWGSEGDGIVDLPLTLNKIIVEMRTDMIYVDEMMPVNDLSIAMDDLMAVYDSPGDVTDQPVKLQRAAKDAWRPRLVGSVLPNPIKQLQETGVGDATVIERVYLPEVAPSGDQAYIKIRPVSGATNYTVYVAAYPDGSGAKAASSVKDSKDPSLILVRRLQPSIPMYLFASYARDGRESKPSEARKTVLRDEFPFK